MKVRSKKTKVVEHCKGSSGTVFHVGDTVQLRPKTFVTMDPAMPLFAGMPVRKGKITGMFPDVKGLVIVEPRLGGFHTWGVDDLVKVELESG